MACRVDGDGPGGEPLTGVKEWKIVGEEPSVLEEDPDSKYVTVLAKIESAGAGGDFSVSRTWGVSVWKPDELFEHDKRYDDRINRILLKQQDLLEMSAELRRQVDPSTAETPVPEMESMTSDRSKISDKEYCVLNLKTYE
jgi:hypothetical protein